MPVARGVAILIPRRMGTGLNLESDVIIEIAVIITDGSLQQRITVTDLAYLNPAALALVSVRVVDAWRAPHTALVGAMHSNR